MNGKLNGPFNSALVILVSLMALSARAQLPPSSTPASTPQPEAHIVQQVTQPNVQLISQTSLLPVFALDMPLDTAWIDGKDVPSKSAQFSHSGVNDTLQRLWEALKPSGFNTLRFPVGVAQPGAAARIANLCIWAKANNVKIVLILKGATNDKKKTDKKNKSAVAETGVAKFPPAVVARLRDAQQIVAYEQISFFQIEDAMNHAGLYPQTSLNAAQKNLLSTSEALRKSEAQALEGTGLQATPIMISASFDYELIRQGAIAGVPLDPVAEQKAQASLKQFVAPLGTSANIEAVNLEWFPRSISSGDVDRFSVLLREVRMMIPNKQLTLTTGFSSAFNPTDQQMQFFVLTFTNLAAFRVSDGANNNFLGAVFRQALQGPNADSKEPPGSGDPSQWNWGEKAQQLWKMWSQGKKSAELTWWLNKVQDNMGLVALPATGSADTSVVPLPAAQAFQQISATVAQVSQNVPPQFPVSGAGSSPPPVPPPAISPAAAPASPITATPFVSPAVNSGAPAYPVGAQGTAQTGPSPYQQALLNLLQQVSSQLTGALVSKFANTPVQGTGQQFSGYPPGVPLQSSLPPQPVPYGPPNYLSTLPASQGISAPGATYPTQPAGSIGSGSPAVWFGPQDVTIDSTNVLVGQPVHIGVLIHNGTADRDVSGLAVLLVDPSNPVSPNQALQSGVTVPRSGTTLAQLTWVAGQASTAQYQLSLQVLDAGGFPIANAALPVIRVTGSSSSSNAGPSQTLPGFSTNVAPHAGVAPPGQAVGPTALPAQQTGLQQIILPPGAIPVRPVPGSGTNTAIPVRPGPSSISVAAVPSSGPYYGEPGTTQSVATSAPSAGIPARPGPPAITTNQLTPVRPGGGTPIVNSAGSIDLSVSAADIQLSPNPPQPGSPATFAAIIHNLGASGVQAASVSFQLVTECRQAISSQPIPFNITGYGAFKAVWTTSVPACQRAHVVVSVNANGDVNPANNQAVFWFSVGLQNWSPKH